MTGFGKATLEYKGKKIVVEIRSLNSKQMDISTRIVPQYREKEIEIRNELTNKLERGKLDFTLYVDSSGKETATRINQTLVKSYYEQIKATSDLLDINEPADWFSILLRMPDALMTESVELDETEWKEIWHAISKAIEQLKEFRIQEGKILFGVFEEKVNRIKELIEQIEPYEAERLEKIKTRIEENLQNISEKIEFDRNRLEQELIFYIEKFDINEEKVRLRNHLDYFIETLKDEDKSAGKKLGFIAQEIGREVNTIGSKANHSEMQKIVVLMKDELEQIKEQMLNVL